MICFCSPGLALSLGRTVASPPHSLCRKLIRVTTTIARLGYEDVRIAAAQRGIAIANNGAGPFLKLEATGEDGRVAGFLTAALLPGHRLHVESYKARPRNADGALLRLSPGMLLFIAAIAIGFERGCDKVFGLAIDDGPQQHARLVAYLRRFGGEPIRRVGESKISDIPDRLIYGGRGTIIRGDVKSMLERAEGMVKRTSVTVPSSAKQS